MSVVEKGISWGAWWIFTHPVHSYITYVLLKNPNTRGLMIDHLILAGEAIITGSRGSWKSITTRLLIPGAAVFRARAAPIVTRIALGATIAGPPVAVGAGVLATSAVISGVIVAGQQKVGLVGPDAPTMSDPRWFHGLEQNPFTIGMGTVV